MLNVGNGHLRDGDSGMPGQLTKSRSRRSTRRSLTWSVVACTALCLLVPRPSYGDPGNNTVPDAGSMPVASAPVQSTNGSQPATVTAPVAGPLGAKIMSDSSAVEALGEQLKQAQIDASAAHDATAATQQAWNQATTKASDLRERANNAAAEAYKKATALGPFEQYAETMHQLGVLAPGFADGTPGGIAGSQTAAQDAARADEAVKAAYTAYQSALTTEQQKDQLVNQLTASYNQRSAALTTLKANNTQAVSQAEAAQEANDQALSPQFAAGSNVDGMVANPIALNAVRFALSMLGAPYYFGAEGPTKSDGYDCSGLTWRSYHVAGINLPRVAKDQYHATTSIDVTKVLPGDLLFFSTTSTTDWTTISHVGIYLGDNKMVEAPHTNDHVKIATVWWSAFFGATRVVPAVPGPTTTPAPSNTPPQSPAPSHAPSPTPSHPVLRTPPAPVPPTQPAPSQAPPTSSAPSSSAPTSSAPTASAAPTGATSSSNAPAPPTNSGSSSAPPSTSTSGSAAATDSSSKPSSAAAAASPSNS